LARRNRREHTLLSSDLSNGRRRGFRQPAASGAAMSVRKRMSGLIVDYLVALPLGCVVALVWANTLDESYYRFAHAAAFAVNEIGIVFFFALITKEVAEATIPG